jgi:drug/metabolite transporter (DMT)-like permease
VTVAAREQRAVAAALLLVLLWGANFSAQKFVFTLLGPPGFLVARSIMIAMAAALLMTWRHGLDWPRVERAHWPTLALATLAGPVGQLCVVTWGIHWSTAFSSAVILAVGPVFTLLLLRLMRGEVVGRARWLGVAVAMAGVWLFLGGKVAQGGWAAGRGDLMLLASAVLFSLYTIWVTPLVARVGGVETTCWTTLLGSPVVLLMCAPFLQHSPFEGLAWGAWAALFYSVLVSAFLGWMIWVWVNAVLGVGRCAPLMYLVPPVAGVVAWLTVGESFGARKLLGAAVILAGVAWTQYSRSGLGRAVTPAVPGGQGLRD